MSLQVLLVLVLSLSRSLPVQQVSAHALDKLCVLAFEQASDPGKWCLAALLFGRGPVTRQAIVDWYCLRLSVGDALERAVVRTSFASMRLSTALPLLETCAYANGRGEVLEALLLRDPEASLRFLLERLRTADEQVCDRFPMHLVVLARKIGPDIARRVALAPERCHKDSRVRGAVLDGLLEVAKEHDVASVPEFFDTLAEAARDDAAEVRYRVADQAYRFEAPRILAVLGPLIDDHNPWVRREALESLAEHVRKDPRLLSPSLDTSLRRLLADEHGWVRCRAAMVLLLRNEDDEDAVRTFAEDLKSDDDKATETALALLCRSGRRPARLIPGLVEALLKDMGEVPKRPRDIVHRSKSASLERLAEALSAYGKDAASAAPILELVLEKVVREIDFAERIYGKRTESRGYREAAYTKIATCYLPRLGVERAHIRAILLRNSQSASEDVSNLACQCLELLSAPVPAGSSGLGKAPEGR